MNPSMASCGRALGITRVLTIVALASLLSGLLPSRTISAQQATPATPQPPSAESSGDLA
jgi:hypothetical protein